MSHWNYRVIRHDEVPEDIWFGIHECYYLGDDDNLEDVSWTEDAIAPIGETPEELLETVEHMRRCLDKPVLMIEGETLKVWKP